MTPVPLSKVLGENTAYLLSYIRIGDSDEGPGARPTSTKSSPMPSRSMVNGHVNGNGHINGNGHEVSTSAASSPSMKRKRQWTEEDDDSRPVTPSRAAYTPPASDSEVEETQERTPIKWAYNGNPNKKSKNLPAPRAQNSESLKVSPIDRPSHPSPGLDSPRRKKDKMRKKMKGAPMPFKQAGNGRNGGGFQKGGKGRHNGKPNGRGPFRG
jgi:ubiquitin carboxyl-terminal hydrolase 36/42